MKKKKQKKRESLFFRVFNRVLKLDHLKRFCLNISFFKGFSTEIEFFEAKKGKK